MKFHTKKIACFLKVVLYCSGIFFLILCVLAFTTLPFYARYRLGTVKGCLSYKPALIIQMGGSGMPSEDGLIRSYYTSLAAKRYPGVPVIIAFPGNPADSLGSLYLFKKELTTRGIPDSSISFENKGRNTRQQAMLLAEQLKNRIDTGTIVIITSPEHMYRAVASFHKAGFRHVTGLPTFERSVDEENLYYNDRDLKGNTFLPPVGQNKQLRYQFWNHLKYEISVLREYAAIGYYKLRAWI